MSANEGPSARDDQSKLLDPITYSLSQMNITPAGDRPAEVDPTTTAPKVVSSELTTSHDKKKGVFQVKTGWTISDVAWANESVDYLALSSFIESYTNYIQLVEIERDNGIKLISTFEHPLPATKVLWKPWPAVSSRLLLATTSDCLRLWRLEDDEETLDDKANLIRGVNLEKTLTDHHAPMTSFDWSRTESLIATSSFYGFGSIWDIIMGAKVGVFGKNSVFDLSNSKLATEDPHLYDVAWSHQGGGNSEIIYCQNGSLRLVDLRHPTTLTVLLEATRLGDERSEFVRVCCGQQEPNLVATFAIHSNQLIIVDLRKPGEVLCTLEHRAHVNAASWSAKSSRGICSGGDDKQVFIWRVVDSCTEKNDPLLAYRADGDISVTSWSPSNTFIATAYDNCLEVLRV